MAPKLYQKIASLSRQTDERDTNMFTSLEKRQTEYNGKVHQTTSVPGVIQNIGYKPIRVFYWTEVHSNLE